MKAFPNAVLLLLAASLLVVGCRTDVKKTAGPKPAPATVEAPIYGPQIPVYGPPPPPQLGGGFKVSGMFGDNMVLQQGTSVPVWGWAADGQTITVNFRGQKASSTAKNGRWTVKLRNLKPGPAETLTVNGPSSVQFTNVVVGEVWLASGQSNMEWPLKKTFEAEPVIASATNDQVRFFVVPNIRADAPQADVTGKWQVSNPEATASFSAVAYYFARDLHAARGVPVGIIQSDWGGSPAEVWMREEVLESNPRYKSEILLTYPIAENNYKDSLAAYEKEKAEALKKKTEFKRWPPGKPWKPSELYNGMIAPLVPYSIAGAIWYQGESNASRAHQYRTLYPDMIRNWRRDWGMDFPFIGVQLAPFKAKQSHPAESDWAELREAQLLATKVLPKTGMVVITDVGDEADIHPTRKAPVGSRLALAARAIAYGEKIVHSGPVFKSMKVTEDRAVLSFDHVGSGLEARGGGLKGFAICGPNRKFYWAIADIQPNNTIEVWSPNVAEPAAVRYGWADFPVVNLWNREGLPASPFRTDDFPMITAPKEPSVTTEP